MTTIKLSKRLQEIASFVPQGSNVADIGTDHGYIPVWLAQNHIAQKIVAADINKGPLDHAKRTADEHGVFDKINFRLCSGLNFSESKDCDTIIIAGMGGELITSILAEAPWTKNHTTLILQPNTKIQDLVEWLIKNEYEIYKVKLIKEAGKYYQILVVGAGKSEPIPCEANRLIHNLYFSQQDPLLPEYIDHLISRYKHAEQGMLTAKEASPELNRVKNLINDLIQMKKEAEAWQL